MNQSHFLAITCNSLEAREKSHVHGAIDFGFTSHRLSFKPIIKCSNRNHLITFDSHLKTALSETRCKTLGTQSFATLTRSFLKFCYS